MATDPIYPPLNTNITPREKCSNPWGIYFNWLSKNIGAAGTGSVTHTTGALTVNEVVLGNGGDDIKPLGSYGTSGQVLTSNGAGLAPSFQSGTGGTVTHTGALTLNQLVLGNGTDDIKPLGSLGTTTTVYHGNAAGAGSFAAVSLTADVSGDLPFSSFVQASAASKLVGRGSAAGAGDFQEISLGSGLTMTATTLSASGTGGTVTNTGTLTANRLILGNGGVDVTAAASLGTTTTVLHGNAAGAPSFGSVDLTADVSNDLPFSSFVQASGASKIVGRGSAAGAGDFQELTISTGLTLTGTVLTASGSGGTVTAVTHALTFIFGDGVSVVPAGVGGIFRVPYTGTITEAALFSSDPTALAGSITITILKDAATNPPTTAVVNTGAGGTKPFLSASNNYLDTTLAHWTTAVTAGDFIKATADATPGTLLQATLVLTIVGST